LFHITLETNGYGYHVYFTVTCEVNGRKNSVKSRLGAVVSQPVFIRINSIVSAYRIVKLWYNNGEESRNHY